MLNVNNWFWSRDIRLQILDFLKFVPDKLMLKIEYRLKTGKKLHINPPRTFNEKLQWLKLYDRNPVYTQMADKVGARDFVKEKIGDQILVPLYGCWESVEDIPFDDLPKQFVLKCTHDSGSVILVHNKDKLNIEQAKKRLNKRLQKNAFWWAREWPYKNIKPRIIAEKYLSDEGNEFLPVYKFFCFNGEPQIIQQIQNDKQENETVDFFDLKWNRINMMQRFPNSTNSLCKPYRFDEMLDIARKLSQETRFLRVDLYAPGNDIYFSEMTFYTDAGYSVFEPKEKGWDEILGERILL